MHSSFTYVYDRADNTREARKNSEISFHMLIPIIHLNNQKKEKQKKGKIMKLLLNYVFVVTFMLIGTMPLQAQQTEAPGQQNQDQEITELIDRMDNLMERAMALKGDSESGLDDSQREGFETEGVEERDEEAVGQRDRTERSEKDKKKDKMVKRLGEDLGMTVGNLKNVAESYQQLVEEENQSEQTAAPDFQQEQEQDAQQQDDQQQREATTDNEDNEGMQEDLEQIKEHLTSMTDEMEKAIETIEKVDGNNQQVGENK